MGFEKKKTQMSDGKVTEWVKVILSNHIFSL